jgi:acyl-CoA thioester hydrolase
MIRHETRVRVRYPDTDQMGVVYHGRYLEYFETGRTELLRDLGLAYATIEAGGILLPVLEAHLVMRRPARYDELLTVVSFLRELPTARLHIDYEIHRDDEILATGATVHAFTTADGMRPVRPPRAFMELMEREMMKGRGMREEG